MRFIVGVITVFEEDYDFNERMVFLNNGNPEKPLMVEVSDGKARFVNLNHIPKDIKDDILKNDCNISFRHKASNAYKINGEFYFLSTIRSKLLSFFMRNYDFRDKVFDKVDDLNSNVIEVASLFIRNPTYRKQLKSIMMDDDEAIRTIIAMEYLL